MDVFIARQPIFTPAKKIFGYELLFRNGVENVFPDVDGDVATSALMSNIFYPFDYQEILGGKPGLINFTEKLLLEKAPLLLPKENFIIEVLEDINPTPELISALSTLCNQGFTLALDDFVFHKKFQPMIALSKIIKFDIRATPLDTLADAIKEVGSTHKVSLLAEKVETYAEFEQAKEMGFDLFQGYFFSKPELLTTRGISSSQATNLKLLDEINQRDLELEKVENLIKSDIALSFKLLKFINSAYFNRRIPINTIKDAIIYLGETELRKFVHVIAMSGLSTTKPNELIRVSIIRARMCELCGSVLNTDFTPDELFTLGLFSVLDAILDCKTEDIFKHIHFSEKMVTALMGKNKQINIILDATKSFESGNWEHKFFAAISGRPLESKFPGFYCDAVKMATSLFR